MSQLQILHLSCHVTLLKWKGFPLILLEWRNVRPQTRDISGDLRAWWQGRHLVIKRWPVTLTPGFVFCLFILTHFKTIIPSWGWHIQCLDVLLAAMRGVLFFLSFLDLFLFNAVCQEHHGRNSSNFPEPLTDDIQRWADYILVVSCSNLFLKNISQNTRTPAAIISKHWTYFHKKVWYIMKSYEILCKYSCKSPITIYYYAEPQHLHTLAVIH